MGTFKEVAHGGSPAFRKLQPVASMMLITFTVFNKYIIMGQAKNNVPNVGLTIPHVQYHVEKSIYCNFV